MKIKKIELEQVAGFKSQWPNDNLDEIAFVGSTFTFQKERLQKTGLLQV